MGKNKDANGKKIFRSSFFNKDKNNQEAPEQYEEAEQLKMEDQGRQEETKPKKVSRPKYVYLAFLDGRIYINKDGEPVISPMTEKKVGRDTTDIEWGGMVEVMLKGKLIAKPGYCADVDVTIEDNKERRGKAVAEILEKFADEIETAKKEAAALEHSQYLENKNLEEDTAQNIQKKDSKLQDNFRKDEKEVQDNQQKDNKKEPDGNQQDGKEQNSSRKDNREMYNSQQVGNKKISDNSPKDNRSQDNQWKDEREVQDNQQKDHKKESDSNQQDGREQNSSQKDIRQEFPDSGQSDLASADMEMVVKAVSTAEKRICEDLSDLGDDVIDAISREIGDKEKDSQKIWETNKKEITKKVEDQAEAVKKLSEENKQQVLRAIDTASQKEQKNIKEVIVEIDKTANALKNNQEQILSKEKSVGKKVEKVVELYQEELCGDIETIRGSLEQLKGAHLDRLDQITAVLSDQGVEISRDFPPTCEEEEDILNLVRYSKKITEQLGYAARELIRKKAAYKKQEESIVNEQKIMEQKNVEAREAGILEGKRIAVKSLLEKYIDVDTIMESELGHVHVIWSFLLELGAKIDGDGYYKKGEIIEFSENEAEKMAAVYKKIDSAGRYRVVKTGLRFAGEIVFQAEFEKVADNELVGGV